MLSGTIECTNSCLHQLFLEVSYWYHYNTLLLNLGFIFVFLWYVHKTNYPKSVAIVEGFIQLPLTDLLPGPLLTAGLLWVPYSATLLSKPWGLHLVQVRQIFSSASCSFVLYLWRVNKLGTFSVTGQSDSYKRTQPSLCYWLCTSMENSLEL